MVPAVPLAAPAPSSLSTELLVRLAVLAAAALLVAVASVAFFLAAPQGTDGVVLLTALIVGDVMVFVLFVARELQRLVTAPLAEAVAAAEAIAAGDLKRRVPDGTSREFAALSASFNRMTDHLLAAQAQRVRDEKLASVGRLAAGIAHEIGNPLGAVNGYTHILKARVRGDALAEQSVEAIERESTRVDRIVRGLLDYARPRRSSPAPIDVNDTARFAVRLLADQGRLRDIDVGLRLDVGAPAMFGERHDLEQLFVNLLLNATDAVRERAATGGSVSVTTTRFSTAALRDGTLRRPGDPPHVVVPRRPSPRVDEWLARVRPSAAIVKVVVSDSGAGVAEEDEERIFDPFFTTKEPGKGTGLGLAIVARVVESLQGTNWVQRAREGGAAFHILFPAAPASATPSTPAAAGARRSPAAPTAAVESR